MNEETVRLNQQRATAEKSRQLSLRSKMRKIEEKKWNTARQNHFGRIVEEFQRRKQALVLN